MHSPKKNKGAQSVRHLCLRDTWFWSPNTFPGCKTPLDYADAHKEIIESVTDMRILHYDQAWAKDGHVLLRFSAEGTHNGKPYKGIEKSDPPKRAKWGAAAIFEMQDGLVKSLMKDWDQKTMQVSCLIPNYEGYGIDGQIQLGWAPAPETNDPRWNAAMLFHPVEEQKAKDPTERAGQFG